MRTKLAAVLAVLCGTACNSGRVDVRASHPIDPNATVDPANAAPVVSIDAIALDHGKASETYPAFAPDIAQLSNNGGDVLKNPEIVTVTFPGEPLADKFEAFGDAIGTTKYWQTLVSEYGVGPAASGAERHVRMTEALPAEMSDTDLDAFVAKNAGDVATSKWPSPTDQTIYVVYLPTTTKLMMRDPSSGGTSDACEIGVGGYHMSTDVSGKQVAYAILPQCHADDLDMTTVSASHELAEAATDPHPNAGPAYSGFDDAHLVWEFFQQFQSENGDACEFYRTSDYRESEVGFTFAVQRQWSNASAKTGHDPCVPAPTGAYFNVTPIDAENVDIDLSGFGGAKKTKTHGFHVAVGETKRIPVGFYSDGPKDAWSIKVYESNPLTTRTPPGRLALSVDRATGKNGEKAWITVTVKQAGRTKSEYLTVVSTDGKSTHYMPIMIGSE